MQIKLSIQRGLNALLFSIVILHITSCEEDFSPRAEFEQRYIVNCIIRSDTTLQTFTVAKSYNIEGYDPYAQTKSPFIKVLDARLWHKNEVYFFKDSMSFTQGATRYDEPIPYYYTNEFIPSQGDSIKIRIIAPDNSTLWGRTKLPDSITWDITNSTLLITDTLGENFSYAWISQNYLSWYLPRMSIYYRLASDSINVRRSVEVPRKIEIQNGIETTVKQDPLRSTRFSVQKSAVDFALRSISGSDPVKSNYIIYAAIIDLLVFDEPLSKYFSNSKGFLDDYTIRVDQTDFSNIEGGFGIFGSYLKQQRGIRIDTDYIRKFGYTAANP